MSHYESNNIRENPSFMTKTNVWCVQQVEWCWRHVNISSTCVHRLFKTYGRTSLGICIVLL